jgi:hypothetical protein
MQKTLTLPIMTSVLRFLAPSMPSARSSSLDVGLLRAIYDIVRVHHFQDYGRCCATTVYSSDAIGLPPENIITAVKDRQTKRQPTGARSCKVLLRYVSLSNHDQVGMNNINQICRKIVKTSTN